MTWTTESPTQLLPLKVTVLPAEYSDAPGTKVGSPSTSFVTLGLGEADFVLEVECDDDAEVDDDPEGDGEPDAGPDADGDIDADAEYSAAGLAEPGAVEASERGSSGAGSAVVVDGDSDAVAFESALRSPFADCFGAGTTSGLDDADGSATTVASTGSAEAELAANGMPKAITSTLTVPATTETIQFFFDDCMASPKQAAEGGLTIDSP